MPFLSSRKGINLRANIAYPAPFTPHMGREILVNYTPLYFNVKYKFITIVKYFVSNYGDL